MYLPDDIWRYIKKFLFTKNKFLQLDKSKLLYYFLKYKNSIK